MFKPATNLAALFGELRSLLATDPSWGALWSNLCQAVRSLPPEEVAMIRDYLMPICERWHERPMRLPKTYEDLERIGKGPLLALGTRHTCNSIEALTMLSDWVKTPKHIRFYANPTLTLDDFSQGLEGFDSIERLGLFSQNQYPPPHVLERLDFRKVGWLDVRTEIWKPLNDNPTVRDLNGYGYV